MTEILLETNKGIVFEKTETKKRCKVSVKNIDGGFTHMSYRFKKGVEPITSQYISWENLNYCGGFPSDESYLLTAVQEQKKLCAGITFRSEKELEDYKSGLSGEYLYFCNPPRHNGPYSFYDIDVVRDGAIRDYINEDEVLRVYDELGIRNYNKKIVTDLMGTPMIRLINGETIDYANAETPEALIVTGLLLGYPLESTAWLLERDGLPASV